MHTLYVWLLQYISVMTSLIKTLWIIPDFLFQCKGDYLIRFLKKIPSIDAADFCLENMQPILPETS